jgi:hypothetical protein
VREEEQRVIDETPILNISWIMDAPPIMQAWNPTEKRSPEKYTMALPKIDSKEYLRRHTFDQKSPSNPKH